jgi:hypothetical protein
MERPRVWRIEIVYSWTSAPIEFMELIKRVTAFARKVK